MSMQKQRQLKLYKKLEKDLRHREKLSEKVRETSQTDPSTQSCHVTRKLNNNVKIQIKKKKYLQQQYRNAQIQRANKILFHKIQSHGVKRHHQKKTQHKNRSLKTLNQTQEYESRNQHRLNRLKSHSQTKKRYNQERSRISFQQNQQLLMLAQYKSKQRAITQQTPQITGLFKSRILRPLTQTKQTILFQGIAQIDSTRFKTKISIKDETYYLQGRNKHTQIMLRMELEQYKKFHRQALMGNPSNIFGYLVLDKGKIKFRTLCQDSGSLNKQEIYKIDELDEQSQEIIKKHKLVKKSLHQKNYHMPQSSKFNYQKYNNRLYQDEQRLQPLTSAARHNIDGKSTQKPCKKLNTHLNSNQNAKIKSQMCDINQKSQDCTHNKNSYHLKDSRNFLKNINSSLSTEIQAKITKNDYKLPYL